MTAIQILIVSLYLISLIFITLYNTIQLHLVFLAQKSSHNHSSEDNANFYNRRIGETFFPHITVQLPVYNEIFVIRRLIDTVLLLEYPKDKLQIQILDDSTDETVEIIAEKTKEGLTRGFDIQHIRRTSRDGFKAGALAEGMHFAKGEFIAIFDADFTPSPQFLLDVLPAFNVSSTGVIQTRWDYFNRKYSLLTKLQAFGLDGHFFIEQTGRYIGNFFLSFNGTAGIWRKQCIEDTGGWQYDTLTEDLDLSYRAQLKGWKIHYMKDVIAFSELPITMNALKSQQYRWNKGAAENLKKHIKAIITSPLVSLSAKIHSFFHLANSSIFPCIFLCAILSIPILHIKAEFPNLKIYFHISNFFFLSFCFLLVFYWHAFKQQKKAPFWQVVYHFISQFPLFLSVFMGLSAHNTLAVLKGYMGYKTPFVRTPKFYIRFPKDRWHLKKYIHSKISSLTLLEMGLMAYFLYGIYTAFLLNDFGLIPFHLMLLIGFGIISFYTFYHNLQIKRLNS